MSYFFIPLVFDTPVHFGEAELGGDLTSCSVEFSSDTFLGAVIHELSVYGDKELLSTFEEKILAGKIIMSDLLPYIYDGNGEYSLYIPKPIIARKTPDKNEIIPAEKIRKIAKERKKQKKMTHLRAGNLGKYINSLKNGNSYYEELSFYDTMSAERVNTRGEEPLPYMVSNCSFRHNTGLYIIAEAENKNDEEFFKKVVSYVCRGGIGGKRSSGYGKAHIGEDINENCTDWVEIQKLLSKENAPVQMAISSIIPGADDLETVMAGWYMLKRRGGFISKNDSTDFKKKSVSILSAGSCFPKRIKGEIVKLADLSECEVKRYGKGLYLGVDL